MIATDGSGRDHADERRRRVADRLAGDRKHAEGRCPTSFASSTSTRARSYRVPSTRVLETGADRRARKPHGPPRTRRPRDSRSTTAAPPFAAAAARSRASCSSSATSARESATSPDARCSADATAALAESLDYEVTVARVARLAVPLLADWCAVDLVVDGERLSRTARRRARRSDEGRARARNSTRSTRRDRMLRRAFPRSCEPVAPSSTRESRTSFWSPAASTPSICASRDSFAFAPR